MCPGCDIAMAMLEAAPSQPAPHSLTALAEEAARTPLIAGGEPDEPDNEPPLYAARRKVYPQRVSGTYRRVKWIVLCFTLGVYYLLPFVRWDRGPNAPGQAVLIDFPSRRFYFFFIEIWPQEFYYLTGLLILAAMALFLMNAVAGRQALLVQRRSFLHRRARFAAIVTIGDVEGVFVGERRLDARPWAHISADLFAHISRE